MLCVDVCVGLLLDAVGVFCRAPALASERRCCAAIKLKKYVRNVILSVVYSALRMCAVLFAGKRLRGLCLDPCAPIVTVMFRFACCRRTSLLMLQN